MMPTRFYLKSFLSFLPAVLILFFPKGEKNKAWLTLTELSGKEGVQWDDDGEGPGSHFPCILMVSFSSSQLSVSS